MRRIHAALVFAIAALIAGPSPLAAQSRRAAEVAPPITWCETPAPRAKWERKTAYFLLAFDRRDSSEAQRALAPYVPHLLGGIARAYAGELQPSRNLTPTRPEDPPRGEPRYGPADMIGAELRFDLRGDGTIDSVIMPDSNRSALVEDMAAALLAAAAAGDVFGPYADSSVRTRFRFDGTWSESPLFARWPAFTMYVPISRPAAASGRNHVGGYPADALGWEGTLSFQYVVDENGRALPETAKVLGADRIVFTSEASRFAFEKFKEQIIGAIPRMRFKPAEEYGCAVPSFVQQDFEFRMR